MSESELEKFVERFGYHFSSTYATGGPLGTGERQFLFGNISASLDEDEEEEDNEKKKKKPRNRFNCGDLVNAVIAGVNSPSLANAMLGSTTVTEAILQRHPDLAHQMTLGKPYPCIRVLKDLKARDEIILDSYGSAYWRAVRAEHEGKVNVWRLNGLTLEQKRFIRELKMHKGNGT
jgi:hypothetical protein